MRPKVAFVCVHNACRSQMAQAIASRLAGDVFDSYSAGTQLKDRIDPGAVETIRTLYGVDMETTQRPKLLSQIPAVDVVVTMGCNVQCPTLSCLMQEDWGLEDPSGGTPEDYARVARRIEEQVLALRRRLSRS